MAMAMEMEISHTFCHECTKGYSNQKKKEIMLLKKHSSSITEDPIFFPAPSHH